MRTLKFRVWHSAKNCWVHDTNNACNILGETIMLGAWCRVPMQELNDLVVEQYTGLKDKNGKEIYEGDVVRLWTSHICEIKHCELHAQILIGKDLLTRGYAKDCEVIGNIHENPELLEVNNAKS
jgi:uncharacterized phage protein (TIGR01671 family)